MVDFRPSREQFLKGTNNETVLEINPVSVNRDHSNSVDALAANPVDRSVYVSGSHDHTIKLWDANSHRCLNTLQGHTDGVWSLNYLSDGRSVISASADGTARLWDMNSGRNTTTLAFHESKCYTAVVNHEMT